MGIRRSPLAVLTLVALVSALCLAAAQPADAKPRVKLKRIGRFHSPTYVTSAPGIGGVVVVERGGRIRLVEGRKRRTFTNISGSVSTGGERGLLSVAFSPDYAASRLLYVYFTDRSGDLEIAELHADGDGRHADPATLRPILIVPHPNHSNHNGGQLQFGPDGLLYAGTGDGGGAGDQPDNAQNPDSRLGKLLRIDPSSGAVGIYSIGLRNPYRFSFDLVSDPCPAADRDRGRRSGPLRGDRLPAAGVRERGQLRLERLRGLRPVRRGPSPHPGPDREADQGPYSNSGGPCAVIGGYVVRDARLRSLFHRYVYGDFCTGKVRSLTPRLGGARKDRGTGVRVRDLSSFGETTDGSLYAASLDGPVYRFVRRR